MQAQGFFDEITDKRGVVFKTLAHWGVLQQQEDTGGDGTGGGFVAGDQQLVGDGHQLPRAQALAVQFGVGQSAEQCWRRVVQIVLCALPEVVLHFD
ncbi:hypothetical protein D9M70_638350 [compost metagenome]